MICAGMLLFSEMVVIPLWGFNKNLRSQIKEEEEALVAVKGETAA